MDTALNVVLFLLLLPAREEVCRLLVSCKIERQKLNALPATHANSQAMSHGILKINLNVSQQTQPVYNNERKTNGGTNWRGRNLGTRTNGSRPFQS